jgi:hypothetical protein
MSVIPLTSSPEVVPVECESAIERVVVYGRGALVTRRIQPITAAQLRDAEEAELWLPGISPQAQPGSMSAKIVAGPGALVAVRATLHLPESAGERSDLTLRLRGLRQRIRRVEEARRLVLERRERLLRLSAKPAESWRARKLGAAGKLMRALELARVGGARVAAFDAQIVALDAELVTLKRELAAAELAASQASSAQNADRGRATWRAMVHVREPGEGLVVEVTYMVPLACWWPVYTLRLSDAGRRATLQVSALVVQDSEEDWQGVALGLSTADLTLDAQLPVLPALRFGKVQPPKKSGYRPLPDGMERLFAAYDQHMPDTRAIEGSHQTVDKPAPMSLTRTGGLPHDVSAPKNLEGAQAMSGASERPIPPASMSMPVGAAMPAPSAAPVPRTRAASALGGLPPDLRIMDAMSEMMADGADYDEEPEKMEMALMSAPAPGAPVRMRVDGGGGRAEGDMIAAPAEPDGVWLDFDQIVMAGPDQAGRGKLGRAPRGAVGDDRSWRLDSWQQDAARQGACDPRVSRGLFDCRYDAAGRVEIPSDARLHKIDLLRADGAARLRWRAVPCERAEVYRMACVVNPLDVPLLDGPIDVFVEGSFLVTDRLARVDRGGEFLVGMGVDDRLRVARNATMAEERAGLLGGKAVITQHVTIDVRSTLGFEAEVEVLDRLPIAGSDAVTVEPLECTPAATAYNQQGEGKPIEGGQRWLVRLAAGGEAKIKFGYKLTLSAKEEIVGGNRREP